MAMMMTGRVLLVCALCVLWCGVSPAAGIRPLHGGMAVRGVTFSLDEAQTEHWRRSCEWWFVARVAALTCCQRAVPREEGGREPAICLVDLLQA
ncbi:mucin-associated surface protein (MASP), putative [Trypanosoma cruzi]|uniref:Mucin-associated surface protein (MASP), putative n=1 Tax=Trypanosoma cruzi (strain CL Brener) TaxID=353153 RepID=Q4D1Z1_TRYCC|nr:mucin-associated surface protein (MASP), putative [Trypanosoma cruzi]EAN86544.1 mucin-associated surface protein (MASP), putative [Trypanosoma cruzi]|eukprot:XP_808395.1 mucin-associated surface protein (MASP) [Trypanosoma cruzi strain CL Brener]